MKSYLKQDNVAPHSFILLELDFDEKFPLLGLLLFLNDLKSTIFLTLNFVNFIILRTFSDLFLRVFLKGTKTLLSFKWSTFFMLFVKINTRLFSIRIGGSFSLM